MDPILISILSTVVSSVLAYLFGRKLLRANLKKQDKETIRVEAQTAHLEVTTSKEAVMIWRGLAQELNKRVSELEIVVEDLRMEIRKLREENTELRKQLGAL